eukprot:Gregarina_sp_Poly_1__6971@NODE_3795_length_878_cov_41_977805_g2440_i0_p1_GENE_NODE_3795_length_878_cov_41_977805_g2440_i0NODE_3795_length_878_cov_41_977805_g2440_i0_p1_ORF_typecomplete_len152_score16_19_NODE_3795_length_878_cov_41_977805_g2440_i0273728
MNKHTALTIGIFLFLPTAGLRLPLNERTTLGDCTGYEKCRAEGAVAARLPAAGKFNPPAGPEVPAIRRKDYESFQSVATLSEKQNITKVAEIADTEPTRSKKGVIEQQPSYAKEAILKLQPHCNVPFLTIDDLEYSIRGTSGWHVEVGLSI